jgi:hypothetical protein
LQTLYADLPQRIAAVRSFLQTELDVPQGSGGTLFIDPNPLIAELPAMRRGEWVDPLGAEYLEGYSQPRYVGLKPLIDGPWSKLLVAVGEERTAIRAQLESLETLISGEGLDVSDLRTAVTKYLDKALELRRAVIEVKQVITVQAFDDISGTLGLRRESISSCIAEAARVVNSDDSIRSVFCFDLDAFQSSIQALRAVGDYIDVARRQITAVTAKEISLEEVDNATREAISSVVAFLGALDQ